MAAETLRTLHDSIQQDWSGELCNSPKRVIKSGREHTGVMIVVDSMFSGPKKPYSSAPTKKELNMMNLHTHNGSQVK